LRNDNNKDELFQFHANARVTQDTDDKMILSTIHQLVVSSNPVVHLDDLQPCSHEEADTTILLHIKDAMNSGYKDSIIRTVDTDVVVLAVAYFQELDNIGNKHRKSLNCFWHRKKFHIYTSAYGKWSTIFPCSVRL